MNRWVLVAALAAGCTFASSAPAVAAARNYDCSKPGNANKAACKGAAKAVAPAAKPAKAAKAKAVTAPKMEKVAKAAKAPKAAKAAAAPAAKPGIFQRMSNALSGKAAKPAPAARRTAASAPASVEDRNPAGAIAQCKDGAYSHSKTRAGACSRHGGVAKWS